jgi:hypothetical protein
MSNSNGSAVRDGRLIDGKVATLAEHTAYIKAHPEAAAGAASASTARATEALMPAVPRVRNFAC